MFTVISGKSISEKHALKSIKKFLKLQESLNSEMDSQKKISAASEDVLANLGIVVEAIQADLQEYTVKYGQSDSKAVETVATESSAPEAPSSSKPKKKSRRDQNQDAVEEIVTDENKQTKKKRKKSSS